MPSTVTKTIGSGGDYATVAAWWAAIPANLVTADVIHRGELLDQEHDCTPTITFSGKTVDATRYIELTTATGASWTDVPSNPMRYGYKARIKTNYDYGIGFFVDAGQVMRLSKFQVINLGTGYTLDYGMTGGGPADMDRVLIEGRAAPNAFAGVAQIGGGVTSKVRQCVVIRTNNYNDAPVVALRAETFGCTFVNLGTAIPNVILGDSDTGRIMKNCGVFGGTNALGGSSTWAASGCATDDASPLAGFTTVAFATGTGAKFNNISAGTHDLRVASGSSLIGAGVQDLTNSTADAYGTTRKNPPDAGAFETPPVAPVLTGNITADDSAPTGSLAPTPPSSLAGSITLDEAVASGNLGLQFSTLTTLPFTRNPGAGGRVVSIANVALAVLTDDANLARLVGSTGILMGSNGRLTMAGNVPAPPGTSVVVVTREPDGKLGVERYTLT